MYRFRSIPPGGIVALTLAILTALLWLPLGLNVGFTGDDWIYFHQVEQGSIMAQAAPTRLFIPIPWLIAYGLHPGSFAGINLMLALMLFGKGVLVFSILRHLRLPHALAFAAAALTLLLPSDTGIFYMGGLHNHFALFCYLLALDLLLIYAQRFRPLALVGIWIALIGCVGITEQVYPLIVVSPLALLLVHPKINRRFVRTALLWYIVPALYAIFYLWIVLSFPRAFAYQNSLIEHPTLSAMLQSLVNIYARHFFTGWFPINPTNLLFGLIAGGLVFAAILMLRRETTTFSPRLILAVSGLAIIGLAVLLYLPTSLRNETVRIFYFSSIGAALTLAALFWSCRPLIFAALIGGLACLGTLRLLDQHQGFYDESLRQQAVWTQLVYTLPQIQAGSGIILVDETPDQAFWNLVHGALYPEDIVPLLYSDPSLEGALCLPADFGTSEAARCRLTAEGMVIPSVRTRYFFRPYDQLIVVRYDGTFGVVDDLAVYTGESIPGYQPERRYDPGGSPPARIVDLFGD